MYILLIAKLSARVLWSDVQPQLATEDSVADDELHEREFFHGNGAQETAQGHLLPLPLAHLLRIMLETLIFYIENFDIIIFQLLNDNACSMRLKIYVD